jgi:hypothetical protein
MLLRALAYTPASICVPGTDAVLRKAHAPTFGNLLWLSAQIHKLDKANQNFKQKILTMACDVFYNYHKLFIATIILVVL